MTLTISQTIRRHWYRIGLICALVTPMVVALSGVISQANWDELASRAYPRILANQQPDKAKKSQIAVVTVDDRTIQKLGWPIDRTYYTQAFERLKTSGHPWIVSTLWFEAMESAKASRLALSERIELDRGMVEAMSSYGRYIGTGLKYGQEEELLQEHETSLMPRVMLSPGTIDFNDLPWLPFSIVEAPAFVRTQAAFGFMPPFGTGIVYCTQMLVETKDIVIPSVAAWAIGHAGGGGFITKSGVSWQPEGVSEKPYALAPHHCLTSPTVTTMDYNRERGIREYSLSDVLDPHFPLDLKDHVVILASTENKINLRGPGYNPDDEKNNGMVKDYQLLARFLDGMLSGQTIRRYEEDVGADITLISLTSMLVILGAFFLPLEGLIGAALLMLTIVVAVSSVNLFAGSYFLPIRTMATLAMTAMALGTLYLTLRSAAIRRQMRFDDRLRRTLSKCNSLDEIETGIRDSLEREFQFVHVQLEYDRRLFDAVKDPESAFKYLQGMGRGQSLRLASHGATMLQPLKRAPGFIHPRFRLCQLETQITVTSDDGELGKVSIGCSYPDCDRYVINGFVQIVANEAAQHWGRVRLLAEQKLADYKIFAEQTRNSIMERFLSQVIVSRFNDSKTMEENLAEILTPRAGRAALMQADIRGYSRVSGKLDPVQMIKLLQAYFQPVVDRAQMVAQVKLIGDCIFLFIERGFGNKDLSPADLTLQLAAVLVKETRKQNAKRAALGEEPLNFGVAIHYGDVVVGNLSSEHCIDYTVIGPNVNLVARMEEMTKSDEIKQIVGENGIILSQDAAVALQYYKHLTPKSIDLKNLGVAIRSFPNVGSIQYFNADEAAAIDTIDFVPMLGLHKRAS